MDLHDIKQLVNKSQERWSRLHIRRGMYENDWYKILEQEVLRQFTREVAERLMIQADTSINIFRWAVDQLCAIYSRPVQRQIEGEDLEMMPRLDQVFSLSSRLTYGLGETLIRPVWTEDRGWHSWLMPPERWTVIPDPSDKSKVILLYIEFPSKEGSGVSRRELWTAENYWPLDSNWNPIIEESTEGNTNPYGVIPWIVTHAEYPTTCFWSDSFSRSLAEAALQFGVAVSDWNNLRHTQSFKQLALKTSDSKQTKKHTRTMGDPASIIVLSGQNDSASVLDYQVDLKSHLDAIFYKAQSTLAMKGITPSLIRSSLDASSGYALKLKMHGQELVWEQQRLLWDLWEEEFWDVARVLYPGILPDGIVTRTWPELGPGRSLEEERKHAMEMVASGLWSLSHARRKLGMTEEEIAQVEAENLQTRALAVPTIPTVM